METITRGSGCRVGFVVLDEKRYMVSITFEPNGNIHGGSYLAQWGCQKKKLHNPTTTFIVSSVMCTICEGPTLDASRSQSVTPDNRQYDSFINIKQFSK